MNRLTRDYSVLLLFLCSAVSQSSCSTYYLDNSLQCTSFGLTQYLEFSSDTAYISAWTSTYNRIPVGSSCSMSISSYGTNGLKFRFSSSSDFIGSGGAVLNIYKGLTTSGEILATYTSGSDLFTSYQHTDSWYITVELQNYQSSINFDFELIVESYDHSSNSYVGLVVGLTVGSIVFTIIVVVVVVAVIMRIKRQRWFRRDVVVTTSGHTYFTEPAPYPQPNYGSVTTTTTSNYPPPPTYPGPPSAESTGYQQSVPTSK